MAEKQQSKGRAANAAQPLGERAGLVGDKAAKATAAKERRSAGPDGPDATAVTKSIRPR